jgi:hypothetical protein
MKILDLFIDFDHRRDTEGEGGRAIDKMQVVVGVESVAVDLRVPSNHPGGSVHPAHSLRNSCIQGQKIRRTYLLLLPAGSGHRRFGISKKAEPAVRSKGSRTHTCSGQD